MRAKWVILAAALAAALAVLAVLAGVLTRATWRRTYRRRAMKASGGDDDRWRQATIDAINAERAKAGLSPVCASSKLDKAAAALQASRVKDPTRANPVDEARKAGYTGATVIAAVLPKMANYVNEDGVQFWMKVPADKATIMNPKMRHVGLLKQHPYWGAAAAATRWTLVFGDNKDGCETGV